MIRNFFIFTFIFIILTSTVFAFAYDFDDRSDLIYYSGKSLISNESAFAGTLSQITNGNSMYFEFSGSDLDIYLARYRNSGDYQIYIDGVLRSSGTVQPLSYYLGKQLVFTTSDLSSGDHFLTIVCPDNYVQDAISGNQTQGRIFIDYISTESFFNDSLDTSLLFFICFSLIILTVLKVYSNVRKVMSL